MNRNFLLDFILEENKKMEKSVEFRNYQGTAAATNRILKDIKANSPLHNKLTTTVDFAVKM